MRELQDLDRNMPILVADDSPSMRRIVRSCLRQLGFENVTEAEGGADALSKLSEADFQFIISDWSMPDMSGTELLSSLRGNDRLRTIPVLLVAAEAEKAQFKPVTEPPAREALIIKPFTRDILKERMADVLEASRK